MKNKAKLFYGLLFLIPQAYADEAPVEPTSHYDAQAHYYSDSDDLEVQQYSLGYNKGEKIFDYRHEQEKAGENLWGVKIERNRIDQKAAADYAGYAAEVSIARKFNDTVSAAASIGRSQLENSFDLADNSLTTYGLAARIQLNKQLELHASHSKNYLYHDAIVEDDNGNLVDGKSTDVSLYWRAHKKIRVQGEAGHRSLSDGNSANKVSGSVLYGISEDWPWIWAGVSAEHLSYDEDKTSYWTPDKYTSYGVLLDSSFPVNDQLSMSLGANLNRSKEDNNPSGVGYSVSAGANWTVSENMQLDLHGSVLKSSQEASDWKQDEVGLSLRIKSY